MSNEPSGFLSILFIFCLKQPFSGFVLVCKMKNLFSFVIIIVLLVLSSSINYKISSTHNVLLCMTSDFYLFGIKYTHGIQSRKK